MMIRKYISSLTWLWLFPVLLLASAGCTRNNGDIGMWFGTWQLERLTVNGSDVSAYGKNIFWKFQNDIISFVKVDDASHTREQVWGTWLEGDRILYLDFTHSDNTNTPSQGDEGLGIYVPFSELGLSYSEVSALKIVSSDGSSLRLEYVADDGDIMGYYLKKQP